MLPLSFLRTIHVSLIFIIPLTMYIWRAWIYHPRDDPRVVFRNGISFIGYSLLLTVVILPTFPSTVIELSNQLPDTYKYALSLLYGSQNNFNSILAAIQQCVESVTDTVVSLPPQCTISIWDWLGLSHSLTHLAWSITITMCVVCSLYFGMLVEEMALQCVTTNTYLATNHLYAQSSSGYANQQHHPFGVSNSSDTNDVVHRNNTPGNITTTTTTTTPTTSTHRNQNNNMHHDHNIDRRHEYLGNGSSINASPVQAIPDIFSETNIFVYCFNTYRQTLPITLSTFSSPSALWKRVSQMLETFYIHKSSDLQRDFAIIHDSFQQEPDPPQFSGIHREAYPTLIQIRSLIIAPIFEELVYRGLLYPTLILSGYSPLTTLFLSSFIFAASHLHHAVKMIIVEKMSYPLVFLHAAVQFTYTYLFSLLNGFLYCITHSLIAVIIAHAFCNYMELPHFSFIASNDSTTHILRPHRTSIAISYAIGVITLGILIIGFSHLWFP